MSLENIDFDGEKKEINSPRSLKACEELGILPEELFQVNFEEFIKKHPDMINLSKEVLTIRFNNIEIFRRKLISEVQQKRIHIIKETEKNKEKWKFNNEQIIEDDSIEKEIGVIMDKGVKMLEKFRQKQKNIVEAQIEKKIQNEMIKLKNDKKEKKIKELNEKIKEERKQKILMEEHRFEEKEKKRKEIIEKNLKEIEKKNEEKQKAEERRIKGFEEMKEKNQIEILFRRTQTFKLLEKRKEKILNQLKETEKKNREKEEKYVKREKEIEEQNKKEREERILFNEKKDKENKAKLSRNKLKKIKSVETLKKILDEKDEVTQKRLNGLITRRNQNMNEQKLRYENKLKSIENTIRKTNYIIQKRNDKILEHQLKVDLNVAKMEKEKNEKILEKVQNQNFLFFRSLKNREIKYKQLQEKFSEYHKKLENKDKKIYEVKIHKLKNNTVKQEDEFIKQYEKHHNIIRLNRITISKNKKKMEEMSKKERKLEKYKIRKQILIEKNMLMSNSIERQKVQLINQFDNVLNKNKEINAELVKKLFPEDQNFFNKIKNMTDQVYKKYNSEKINFNNNSNKDKEIFLTQHNKNNNETNVENKDEIK